MGLFLALACASMHSGARAAVMRGPLGRLRGTGLFFAAKPTMWSSVLWLLVKNLQRFVCLGSENTACTYTFSNKILMHTWIRTTS